MIKIVASDMDGTLLGHDGKISERNIRAIRELEKRGILFLTCTGRGYEEAGFPTESAGISCDIISMNGAAVHDRYGNCMDKKELTQENINFILSCCENETVVFDFMTDKGSYTTVTPKELKHCLEDNVFLPTATQDAARKIAERFHHITKKKLLDSGFEFFKVSVIHKDRAVLDRIRRKMEQNKELSVVSSFETNMEITSIKASKGNTLLNYAALKGIRPHEIMAIGDSENDYSMLSLKLGFTIAMENGMDSIKKAARLQTRSNLEDGVAFAIETLILSEQAARA